VPASTLRRTEDLRVLRYVLLAFVTACAAPVQPVNQAETVPTNQQDTDRWKVSPQGPPLPVDAVHDHGDDTRAVYKVRLPYDDLYRDYVRYLPTAGFTVSNDRQTGMASSAVFDITDGAGAAFTIVLAKEDENTTQIELMRNQ
jgi:hypothetical protein